MVSQAEMGLGYRRMESVLTERDFEQVETDFEQVETDFERAEKDFAEAGTVFELAEMVLPGTDLPEEEVVAAEPLVAVPDRLKS